MSTNQQKTVAAPIEDDADQINLIEYFDIAADNKWLIALVAFLVFVLGTAYAVLTEPTYEANVMVQVEDSDKSAGSFLGDATAGLLDVKTPAAGEIEIIRSRMILDAAAENTKLYISATPRYTPIIGRWLSKRADELSEPGVFGYGGFVSGTEEIKVSQLDVPSALDASPFMLTAGESGAFFLSHPDLENPIGGRVGTVLDVNIPRTGKVRILVSELQGRPGAQFRVTRYSKQLTTNELQDQLKVVEKGKQSGVIDVSLQGKDKVKLTEVLNEIGRLYVRQNIERKSAEAEKTLGFLGTQLPEFKKQMESAEDIYNKFRNERGTVSLDEEAKNALTQLVDLQSKILEAEQRRRDLLSRFTPKHPSVQTIESQIAAINSQIGVVNAAIKRMPLLQQDTVRMQRNIKVNTDLYVSLLNTSLQMSLAKEGKIGNARLLDEALVPEESIKPKRALISALSLVIGVGVGIALAIAKSALFGGVRHPNEIEAHTGLNVYSTIPLSAAQIVLDKDVKARAQGVHLLSLTHPDDAAVESLRSLRTALQFAMLDAPNNRLLISGATPGVGKSFVSANFAAIVAMSGKRVLLIDADLRKGYINQVFAKQRARGLSELIAGTLQLDAAIHKSVAPNLDFITTGILPPNPAELLMSESFVHLLDILSPNYDLVVIDTAPVLVASDTAAVSPHAGTVLLVARANKTHLGELTESSKRLAHVGATVNGVILNAMDMTRRHYGSYGYKYGGYRYTQYKYENATE